jgi:arylsulfatase A-like enzyme
MPRPLSLLLLATLCPGVQGLTQAPPPTPNLVVILLDDMGYADIGPFGGEIPTPNLDRMAKEGRRFTDFAVSSPVCSASRAALLTGCYHRRVGIGGALGPNAEIGLADDEVTLAQLCQSKGYATACFGKWHLGHHPRFLPLRHGFDEYFGPPRPRSWRATSRNDCGDSRLTSAPSHRRLRAGRRRRTSSCSRAR